MHEGGVVTEGNRELQMQTHHFHRAIPRLLHRVYEHSDSQPGNILPELSPNHIPGNAEIALTWS